MSIREDWQQEESKGELESMKTYEPCSDDRIDERPPQDSDANQRRRENNARSSADQALAETIIHAQELRRLDEEKYDGHRLEQQWRDVIKLERNLADKKRRGEEPGRLTRAAVARERRKKEIAAHLLETRDRQHEEDELRLLDSI